MFLSPIRGPALLQFPLHLQPDDRPGCELAEPPLGELPRVEPTAGSLEVSVPRNRCHSAHALLVSRGMTVCGVPQVDLDCIVLGER